MTDPLTIFLYIVAVIGGIGAGVGLAVGSGTLIYSIFYYLCVFIDGISEDYKKARQQKQIDKLTGKTDEK